MDYDEKLALLSDEDFFTFFGLMKAEPRWVNSAGKHAIQLLGLCHHGESHSAVFDPTTLKVTCFSECGGGMLFHTWVKRVLGLENPQDAKDFVEDWIDGQEIDFENRVPRATGEFEYKERPFEVKEIPPVEPIADEDKERLYSEFDTSLETLGKLVWHTEDHIDPEILALYDVAYFPKRETIILPHHNINGGIIGLYERSFRPLRRDVKKQYPDMSYKDLVQYPRAKYVPLLKAPEFLDEDDLENKRTSWSFPNTQNLYGFHLAKDAIKETGEAIIFEGGKSVMLAHQYGHYNAVATHTFGAHFNHIAMLINAGAKKIYLGFDKQYQSTDGDDKQWMLYDKKTRGLAEKVGNEVDVYRLIDDEKDPHLRYKDAPIDQGKEVFEKLLKNAEPLMVGGQKMSEVKEAKKAQSFDDALASIGRKKRLTLEEVKAREEAKYNNRGKERLI